MSIIIGSARVDEKGTYSGGASGDQKQTSSTNDTKGEVSMQPFYVHSKGWMIHRPKKVYHADKIAENMKDACNNKNLGYDQYNRLGVIENGIDTKKKTECDCSSLVRECVKEATGKDPGNFNTENEGSKLQATGLFEKPIEYKEGVKLYNGDVLVTKTKGHTVIVVSGRKRSDASSSSTAPSKSGFNKTKKWTGVTTTALNVRTSAGKKDDNICSWGPLKKGTEISVCDQTTSASGTKWYYIKNEKNGKYGFVNSKYVKKA